MVKYKLLYQFKTLIKRRKLVFTGLVGLVALVGGSWFIRNLQKQSRAEYIKSESDEALVSQESPAAELTSSHPLQRVYDKYEKHKNTQPKQDYLEGIKGYFSSIGDIESVKTLIQYGVDVRLTDRHPYYPRDETPIVIAARNSQCEMVEFLADYGATLNPREWFNFMRGTNVLFYDSLSLSPQENLNKRLHALEHLLDTGTPVNRTATYNRFEDDEFNNFSLLPVVLKVHGKTPSEQAYLESVIQMLLKHDAKLSP